MKKYYIIRTQNSGVWFGNLKSEKGEEITIINARRIWYWDGAASLSQLAIDGTTKPENCKFPESITDEEGVYLTQVIEILPCTEAAVKSINSVKIWKK